MKLAKAKKLKNGIYRIWWKDNTTSLAAVGRSIDGTPWLAPTNWTNVLTGRAGEIVWRLVDTARLNGAAQARVPASPGAAGSAGNGGVK